MFKKSLIFMVMAFMLLAGCSGNKEEKAKETSGNEVAKEEEPNLTYPLTGETAQKDKDVNHRSVAVMVNNHPKARPQSGLNQADLVYEMLAESNITRFLAIYQSEFPEKIGPIRSARDYYIETAKGYNSLFVFHGWSPDAKKLIESGYVDDLNGLKYDGTLFKRSSDRKAPHNSYITYKNIQKGAEKEDIKLEGQTPFYSFLTDEEAEKIQGEAHTKAKVSYSSADYDVTYQYDENKAKYTRYTVGNPTEDQDSGEAVELDNILIIEAPHRIIDDAGRRDIDLTSGGKAYLLQKGKYTEIQWESKDSRIVPILNGQEAKLLKGKTWINVVPSSPGLGQTVTFQQD